MCLYTAYIAYIHSSLRNFDSVSHLASFDLTFAVGRVEGFVGLDKNVARLEGHHDNLLQESIRELGLEVHILLHIRIFTEVTWRNLKAVR